MMKLRTEAAPNILTLTDEQIDAELEKGFVDLQAGKTCSAKAFFDELREAVSMNCYTGDKEQAITDDGV